MKTKHIAGVLIASLMVVALSERAEARAQKAAKGSTLPALDVKYVGETPDLKGKPLIVEFWATWCPPCRQSIPHLNELYKTYKDRGLVVIGLTDEDKSTIKKFQKDIPMDYFVAIDDKLSKEFGVTGIPHALLVDKDGKIVWEGHPMSLKKDDIEALLK